MNKPINWYGIYVRFGRWAYWLSTPVRWLLLSHTHRGYVLIESDARVLVVNNWFGSGEYSLPGGGIHGWERAVNGVRREVKEELRIELSDLKFLGEGFVRQRFGGKHYLLYHAVLSKNAHIRRNSRELAEAKWVTLHQLEEGLLPCSEEVHAALRFRQQLRK